MYNELLRIRLLALLNTKGLSEYQVSLDLGRSQGYLHSITSGKNLPSMEAFFDICNYFELTPSEFFDSELNNPTLIHKINQYIKKLNDEDLILLLSVLNRIVSATEKT